MTILLSDFKCEQSLIVDGYKVDPQLGGQITYGNLFSYDQVAQSGNFIWVQEAAKTDFGGFSILDYDPTTGVAPTAEQTVAVFGLGENPTQPGAKNVGIGFAQPSYEAAILTDYDGNVQFQSIRIPHVAGEDPIWQWPSTDGVAGSTLTSGGNGILYWTDPPIPPALITDTDTTDILIDQTPLWTLVPVTVTATQPSIPSQVTLDISFYSNNNGQFVNIQMLVDGVQSGQVYSVALPRNAIINEHYSWSPILPNGNEVITIEVQSLGGQACFIYGATGDPTVLNLLEPGGVAAARAQGTSYVVSRETFAARFLTVERENRAKFLNHRNIGMGVPSWEDVDYILTLTAKYSTGNVNLLDQDVIDGINFMETLGILAPGRAAVILAT